MGFVGDLLGIGGNSGSSFRAQSIPIMQGFGTGDPAAANTRANQGLDQQQAFLNALQGQNALGNQSSVFNQQQNLANQLQGLAQGTGPNPAMAQLANTTGQNIANQAALMAGQRGASQNSGLLARQIGQQGMNAQQQAVGQGAAMAAQQQLAGINALQQQQGMMGNLANVQANQQANALSGYNQAAQGNQANLLNALGQYNSARVSQQNSINQSNAGIAGQTAQGQQGLLGGLMGGVGSLFGLAHGGEVPSYADGGMVQPSLNIMPTPSPSLGTAPLDISRPSSFAGNYFSTVQPPPSQPGMSMESGFGKSMNENPLFSGVKGLVGGSSKMFASQGAVVPGKAPIKGDSIKNDKVPAMLSPKEIVLPRSVTLSADAPEKARSFVEAILARNRMRKA